MTSRRSTRSSAASGTARYLYNEPLDLEATSALLERRKTLTMIDEETTSLVLAAGLLKGTGTVIGHVNLEVKSREHRQGEIGYVLHPDHQGHGYATEAASRDAAARVRGA